MKRILFPLFLSLIMVCFLVPVSAVAMNLNIGINTFYAWWSPSFKDLMTNKTTVLHPAVRPYNAQFNMCPSFLVGPSLSMTLPAGFSLSAVFLWGGWYHARADILNYQISSANIFTDSYSMDIKKWDLDVLLNYQLTEYMKIFTGLKYQGYNYDFSDHQYLLPSFYHYYFTATTYNRSVGPGIGVSFNLNLAGPLYLLVNASALYLYTNLRINMIATSHLKSVYNAIGFNGTVSLAWYIEPASVTISLGFRYQYLHYFMWDSQTNDWYYSMAVAPSGARGNRNILTSDDHFYGITLAAIYSLNFLN